MEIKVNGQVVTLVYNGKGLIPVVNGSPIRGYNAKGKRTYKTAEEAEANLNVYSS